MVNKYFFTEEKCQVIVMIRQRQQKAGQLQTVVITFKL